MIRNKLLSLIAINYITALRKENDNYGSYSKGIRGSA